jgi:hypothetical protein
VTRRGGAANDQSFGIARPSLTTRAPSLRGHDELTNNPVVRAELGPAEAGSNQNCQQFIDVSMAMFGASHPSIAGRADAARMDWSGPPTHCRAEYPRIGPRALREAEL